MTGQGGLPGRRPWCEDDDIVRSTTMPVHDDKAFLGFRFAQGSREALTRRIETLSRQSYGFVITPNVDFVTRADQDPAIKAVYDHAALQICDSRVLAKLAGMTGVALDVYPGSDLVADLLANNMMHNIGIIGPSHDDWRTLVARFPKARTTFIASPGSMAVGSEAWSACLHDAADADWDILLVCFGSPKQERFADALAAFRQRPGVALCVGASIDFLTDRQRRAPVWMQKSGVEWLHRLMSNPARLWRRYLIDCPRIFRLVLREKAGRRASGI